MRIDPSIDLGIVEPLSQELTNIGVLQSFSSVSGFEIKEDNPIETQKPSLCPSCKEPNDPKARFCWKCGMILDKSLTEGKLKEEAKQIEDTIMRSEVVDASTKRIIETFPADFKDLILESVLTQILENPEMKERFRKELSRQ